MSMAIKNTLNLIKVQFKQKYKLLIYYAYFLGFIKFITLLFLCINNNFNFITDIGQNNIFLSVIFIPILAISSSNILRNEELTMYPGTIRTRYISRILTDIFLICSIYFILLGINIISEGFIYLLRLTGQNVGTVFLFDIKYWLIAFAVYVSLGTLVYLLIAVINTFAEVLPHIISIIITMVIFLAGRFEVFCVDTLLNNIFDFHFKLGMGIDKLVLHAFIVNTCLFIIGVAATFLTKTWKNTISPPKNFIVYLLDIFVLIFILSGYIIYSDYDAYEPSYEGRTMEIEIPNEIDLNNYPKEISTDNYNFGKLLYIVSPDEYEKYWEKVDISDDKAYVCMSMRLIAINNKNLSKRILENTEVDLKNQQLVNTNNEDYYIINNFLGNMYLYTSDYNLQNDYSYMEIKEFNMLTQIVYK